MLLYKNVDICDLESIVSLGILPLDECKNDNWEDEKRAKNATDVVYLFKPTGRQNSFPNYGVALLEVDVDASANDMLPNDYYIGQYDEFVVKKVAASQINRIFIPDIFKKRISLSADVLRKTCWCSFYAEKVDRYDHDKGQLLYKKLSSVEKERFAETASIDCAKTFNFFRGENPDRTMIDVYNIVYGINSNEEE